jgi:hypothetical protein
MADLNDADEPIEMDGLVDEQHIRTALINKLGKARSLSLKKKKDRAELLDKVAKDHGNCFYRTFADSNREKIAAFDTSIQDVCSTSKNMERHWTGVRVAEKLLEFHDLLVGSDRARTASSTNSKRDAAFVMEIRKLVHAAETELQTDAEKTTMSVAKKVEKYRSGGKERSEADLLSNAHPTRLTCPFCAKDGHHPTLVMVDHEENKKKIDENKLKYEVALAEFNNTPAKDRSKTKPPKLKAVKQMVGCACAVNHHKGNVEGNGCHECSGRRAINPLYLAGREHCMTCSCYCTAWFPLDETPAIVKYLKDEGDRVLAGDAPVVQTGIVVCANMFKTQMTTTAHKIYKKTPKFQTTN